MDIETAVAAAIGGGAIKGIREAVRKLLRPKPIKPEARTMELYEQAAKHMDVMLAARPNDRYFEMLDRITEIARDRQRRSESQ